MSALPFDPKRMAWSLRPLDFSNPVALTSRQLSFFKHYDIDFSQRWPELQQLMGNFSSELSNGEHKIAHYVFRQPQAEKTLFIVHGYFDHTGLYGRLIEYGLERGYNVVMFDLPGHGLSSGERLVIEDFTDYVQVLKDCFEACREYLPGPWHIAAQSTGCSIVMDYLLHTQEPLVERVVLLAPLVRPSRWWWVSFAYSVCKGRVEYVPRRFNKVAHDKTFLKLIQNDALQSHKVSVRWVGALHKWIEQFLEASPSSFEPLVIQGDADTTVDWRYNLQQVQAKFPQARLCYLKDAHHHLVNEDEEIRAHIFHLLDGYLV